MIIVSDNDAKISELKAALSAQFDMSDLEGIKTLLSIQITRLRDRSIFIHQADYLQKLLNQYDMMGCRLIDTLITSTIVSSDIPFDQKEYQSIISGII
jgi:hypothetical protein